MNNIKSLDNSILKISGEVTFILAMINPGSKQQREIIDQIESRRALQKIASQEKILTLESQVNELVKDLNRISEVEKTVIKNLNPTVGRTMLANNLTASSPTNVMRVNYVALGTGTTAPVNGDTTLETEVYRNATASATNASNVAYITGFYTATETTGTYREAGLFSDGTASADTGVLVSRVAINITKTITNTLTVDWQITFS